MSLGPQNLKISAIFEKLFFFVTFSQRGLFVFCVKTQRFFRFFLKNELGAIFFLPFIITFLQQAPTNGVVEPFLFPSMSERSKNLKKSVVFFHKDLGVRFV